METWPITDTPSEGMEVGQRLKVTISESLSGYEQRRKRWATPRLRWSASFDKAGDNTLSNLNLLWNFYEARGATFEAFIFHDPDESRLWENVLFGAGDDTGGPFTLPMYKTTSTGGITVKVDGVTETHVTFDGSGANDRRRVSFAYGYYPAAGTALTVSFTGRRSIAARFESDYMSYQAFSNALYSFGVGIVSVKGE